MISPLWISMGAAFLMAGLFIEALIFRAMHTDHPSIYRLFAVRDKLVRLVVEGKIDRHEPHFEVLYANVSLLLESGRRFGGPHGRDLVQALGNYHTDHPGRGHTQTMPPVQEVPESLLPLVTELRAALEDLIHSRVGVIVRLDSRRRGAARIRQARAKALLRMILEGDLCAV